MIRREEGLADCIRQGMDCHGFQPRDDAMALREIHLSEFSETVTINSPWRNT
jgi:hypothetical protein